MAAAAAARAEAEAAAEARRLELWTNQIAALLVGGVSFHALQPRGVRRRPTRPGRRRKKKKKEGEREFITNRELHIVRLVPGNTNWAFHTSLQNRLAAAPSCCLRRDMLTYYFISVSIVTTN